MYKKFSNTQNSTPQPEQSAAYTVSVSVNPANGGIVSRNPNQANYKSGTRVNVMAAPAKGYTFTG